MKERATYTCATTIPIEYVLSFVVSPIFCRFLPRFSFNRMVYTQPARKPSRPLFSPWRENVNSIRRYYGIAPYSLHERQIVSAPAAAQMNEAGPTVPEASSTGNSSSNANGRTTVCSRRNMITRFVVVGPPVQVPDAPDATQIADIVSTLRVVHASRSSAEAVQQIVERLIWYCDLRHTLKSLESP